MATTACRQGNGGAKKAHNNREEKCVKSENEKAEREGRPKQIYAEGEIRPDGRVAHHEQWIHKEKEEAYKEYFSEAVEKYNQGKKPCRQITVEQYYQKIAKEEERGNKNDRHTSYELVVGVYGDDVTTETKRDIAEDYLRAFQEKYGQTIKVFDANWHDDENGQPHAHFEYLPIKDNGEGQRGMSKEIGLDKALRQLGFEGKDGKTPLEEWTQDRLELLDRVAREHGVEHIEHPMQEGKEASREHMQKVEYIHSKMEEDIKYFEQFSESMEALKQACEPVDHSKSLFNKRNTIEVDKDGFERLNTTMHLIQKDIDKVIAMPRETRENLEQSKRAKQEAEEHLQYAKRFRQEASQLVNELKARIKQAEEPLKSNLIQQENDINKLIADFDERFDEFER